MHTKIGTDIVYIPKFAKIVQEQGEIFLTKVFLDIELRANRDVTHLAGIFAAKEAILKAVSLPPGSWLQIQIANSETGRPYAVVLDETRQEALIDISISHDHEYAIAVCAASSNEL